MYRHYKAVTLVTLLLIMASVFAAEAAPPAELNRAQQLMFIKDHLQGVFKGSCLNYNFSSVTKGAESFTDKIKVTVTDVVGESQRNLEFDFLSGPHHIDFSPAVGYTGNPVIIHFMERDISRMSKDSGGSNSYFRNRIRDSFKQPTEIRDIKITFDGKEVNGTEVVVTPFIADPNAVTNLKMYIHKRYEITFSDQVPGGIYRIHTVVPDENGKSASIDEAMTFQKLTPAS
ncbi:MAG: hypothetical protein LC541_08545 [Candidatus Thiodiazotropha sp.]|nr:hypothetical protein [Candidatus Thiodiazotropha sp.]MCU7840479.1 hypothetical protein [Candidatus Thiodiazotropha sp. (ex Troendleina suluensis)]MCU7866485.1 hypothetical protein [Candidatus Thiodiazotropha sp. (ex Lucinoma borealis)]MCU7883840.1 hypothetical protein [Candidatus Thiodiazotropha sp. (ex Lucinoma annulata)]MCM8883332.1 hypothetical protein [Candidatus Thiodiazotropha sp.]